MSTPSWFEISTLLAIFFGPVIAVLVTRYIDRLRERRSRRMEIFRSLMTTRRLKLSPEHVSALNLIEIEYYKNERVLEKWKAYVDHLQTSEGDPKRWNELADAYYTELVQAIGRTLGYNIEQLSIFQGGYAPRGWEMVEAEQTQFRKLVIEVLEGNRPFPIIMAHTMQGNPMFPPPPH